MSGIQAVGVQQVLGGRSVLDGVDLELEPGTCTLLAGRNGAGKTTLLWILAGIRRADGGEVTCGEQALREMPPRERARRVALIPQEADCPFEFTGRELVLMGRHPHIARFHGPSTADHAAVDRAIAQVDALQFADRPVTTLSGGELRRIGIARALATEAEVLLADEPTANLDLEHALLVLRLFAGLAEQGRTVLVASHDLNLIAPRMQRVALLHDGVVLREGRPEDALAPEAVERVFGVRSAPPDGFFPRAFEEL